MNGAEIRSWARGSVVGFFVLWLTACEAPGPTAEALDWPKPEDYTYIIGAGDSLTIFVWRNGELTRTVAVRPDGKISVPLVEDLLAAGKTPTELAREIEGVLSTYVREPLVTVILGGAQGSYNTQVRVLGEATRPTALPYRDQMSLLDVMISVGGLTEFADGNEAKLVRYIKGEQRVATVRLEDLVKDGDITANLPIAPGDVIIIPEAWF